MTIRLGLRTDDNLRVYDLDRGASELWVVAGPDGVDPSTIDPNNLPEGFRWVEDDEWEKLGSEDSCYTAQKLNSEVEFIRHIVGALLALPEESAPEIGEVIRGDKTLWEVCSEWEDEVVLLRPADSIPEFGLWWDADDPRQCESIDDVPTAK